MMCKRNLYLPIVAILILMAGCSTNKSTVIQEQPAFAAESPDPPEYVIRAGDELEIKFFYNHEMNEVVRVRPDGKISLQLVDEVQAAGQTPSQLDQVLTEKYASELRDPVVTVIVRLFAGQSVYVGGEVNIQGPVEFSPGMTPFQAVINAGGFKETAKPEGVIVIRKGPENRPVPVRVDLKEVMKGESQKMAYQLQARDVVYVPKTWIAEANKFVNQYIEQLLLYRGVSLGFYFETQRVKF